MINARWIRLLFLYALLTVFAMSAQAQLAFDGAPDPKRGVFIKLIDLLDDKRGFCLDIPGHLQGVNVAAALVVHTCKDGFWNYDGRFDEAALKANGQLLMPAYDLCLSADRTTAGSALHLMACEKTNPRQGWTLIDAQLRLKAHPNLCLAVADTPSEVSRGTRNHPVRHLVRPIALAPCTAKASALQSWVLTPPSDRPGVRFPDGSIRSR